MFENFGSTDLRPKESLKISSPRPLLLDRSIRGGFDSNGRVIEETIRYSGSRPNVRDEVPSCLDNFQVVERMTDGVVWGGAIVNHFGHFLTETVSRLWSVLPGGPLEGLPVVFTTPVEQQFIREWLNAFSVRYINLPAEGVVRFDNAFIPEPAWRLNGWIAPEVRAIHAQARRGLAIQPNHRADILWFSRGGLKRGRIPYDERLLEWVLRRHVTVVQPESMSLAEQVAAVEACQAVAGVVGSAFHTLLLANVLPECLYLCPGRFQSAHVAQDLMLGTNASFAYALATAEVEPRRRAKSPGGRRLLIPEVIRALGKTVPALLEDPEVEIFAYPERFAIGAVDRCRRGGIEEAVARVTLDPFSIPARMTLGNRLEQAKLVQQAAEQFAFVADIADDHTPAALKAARIFSGLDRPDDASEMARRVLDVDPTSREARSYV